MVTKEKLDNVERKIRTMRDLSGTLKNVLRVDEETVAIMENELLRVDETKEIENGKSDGVSYENSRDRIEIELKELRENISRWNEIKNSADESMIELEKSREIILKEYEENSVGFGVTLLERDDVTRLMRGEEDKLFVSEVESLLRDGKVFPYGMDERILTMFGENRRLYDKLLEFENVRLLIEKNDFYVADEYEIALKIYDMVYSGNITDKQYLKEYLSNNGRVMNKGEYDAAVKDIVECGEVWDGENEQFNPGNMDELFDRLIKWW